MEMSIVDRLTIYDGEKLLEQYAQAARTDPAKAARLRLWIADCAAHVLHLFEAAYPEDMRPREAIAATRAYARGTITKEELEAALADAWAAADAAEEAAWAARAAAARAALAADWVDAAWAAEANGIVAWVVARAAAWAGEADGVAAWVAAGAAGDAAGGGAETVDAARDSERIWQFDRLRYWATATSPEDYEPYPATKTGDDH